MSKKVELKEPTPKKNDTDVKKESIETGKVTTDSGAKVEPVSPAIPEGAEHKQEDEGLGFTRRELWDLTGELKSGEEGYLPLDREGNVQGPAKKGFPPEGQLACKVVHSAQDGTLMTPSGAPIQKRMNPDPDLERAREHARDDVTEGKEAPKA